MITLGILFALLTPSMFVLDLLIIFVVNAKRHINDDSEAWNYDKFNILVATTKATSPHVIAVTSVGGFIYGLLALVSHSHPPLMSFLAPIYVGIVSAMLLVSGTIFVLREIQRAKTEKRDISDYVELKSENAHLEQVVDNLMLAKQKDRVTIEKLREELHNHVEMTKLLEEK